MMRRLGPLAIRYIVTPLVYVVAFPFLIIMLGTEGIWMLLMEVIDALEGYVENKQDKEA